jgi:hypothetical protein
MWREELRERVRAHDEEWNPGPLTLEERVAKLEQLMVMTVWALGRLANEQVSDGHIHAPQDPPQPRSAADRHYFDGF